MQKIQEVHQCEHYAANFHVATKKATTIPQIIKPTANAVPDTPGGRFSNAGTAASLLDPYSLEAASATTARTVFIRATSMAMLPVTV